MFIKRKEFTRVKFAYYSCSSCGRQISSEDYYTWGKCDYCRY